jgi:hypothetical protein
MKPLQPITTTLLTLMLLVAGTLGFTPQAFAVDPCGCEFALYADERPSGTRGDVLTANAWNFRTINTDVIVNVGSPPSISRSGNEITLQPGTYYIHVMAEAYVMYANKLRLQTTDNETLAVGLSQWGAHTSPSHLLTYVVVTSETTFRIQQWVRRCDGAAVALGKGPEVYLTVHIIKVTDDGCH